MSTAQAPPPPTPQPPPRGTRPRDRRDQIRAAAATLFYERGYEQVSIADVAESVNVGPSALYRHFSGKAELLYAAIDQTINAFGGMVDDLPSRDLRGIAQVAARTALAHRPLGVLWQREGRNLPDEQRAELRHHLRSAIGTLSRTLQGIRPELSTPQAEFLAAAGVNAMSSISFHRLHLPAAEFEDLLTELALRVLGFGFPDGPGPERERHVLPPPEHRRDEIAVAAAVLFAERGFDAVSVDDVGAAVGIAGPSIYNHFTSKQHLLFASMSPAYAMLQEALSDAIEVSSSPAEALRRITDSYVDLAFDHSDLITNLIAESRSLGEEYQHLSQRAQLGYIRQWVAVVQELRPEEDLTVSRIKVQAAQMMANSIGRTVYLRQRPGFHRDLTELAWLLQQ